MTEIPQQTTFLIRSSRTSFPLICRAVNYLEEGGGGEKQQLSD